MAKRIGVPRELAAAIYAETAARELDKPTDRSLLRGVWIGLAALAAFPFSLSALAVICSLGVALVVSAGSMLLSLLLSAAAIAAYGVWSLVHSFAFLSPFSPGSFLISLGSFFLLTPLGLALLALFLFITKKLLIILTEKIAATIQRRTTHEA